VRDGLTTIWDEQGRKRSAIEYKGGNQHGPATYWDETGKVARVERWENDKKVE
jgi:antitoxin component YwqK of YwqJK toxin-antitoxin module